MVEVEVVVEEIGYLIAVGDFEHYSEFVDCYYYYIEMVDFSHFDKMMVEYYFDYFEEVMAG